MNERIPPHDLEAEESLLGASLLSRSVVEGLIRLIDPSDFYRPAHGHIFAAILSLYEQGAPIDPVTVSSELRRLKILNAIGGPAVLISLQSNVPAISSASRYAEVVKTHSAARKQLGIFTEAMDSLYGLQNPYGIADGVGEVLTSLDRVHVAPKRFWANIDDFLDMEDIDLAPFIIPGICYADSIIIWLATEKAGKSVALRQCAYCASQGLHPFRLTEMEPIRVFVLDAENKDRELVETGRGLRKYLKTRDTWDPTRISLFSRPQNFDLRSARDRTELESALELFKPDLIVGGPVYKLMPANANESDSRYAAAFIKIMGDIVQRHHCALMLEHHAPMGNKRDGRAIRSIGGTLWQAWPDVTIALEAKEDNLEVKKPHPTRGVFDFPKMLRRGRTSAELPWMATYSIAMNPDGTSVFELPPIMEAPEGMDEVLL